MAAEEELCHSLQVSKTAHTNEHVMSQGPLPAVSMDHNAAAAAAAALDHNAGRAATASDCTSQWQSATSMPIIAMSDHNSIDASDINSSQIPTNNLVALQYDHPEQISSIAIALISPSKKIHARCSSSGKEEEEEEVEERDREEEEEEEGCATPTAREQRIPQYNKELICPPAPKKKPCASKRRRLFYSADDHGAANYHIGAERRPFFVDPPDLHNFPDCIRALFK